MPDGNSMRACKKHYFDVHMKGMQPINRKCDLGLSCHYYEISSSYEQKVMFH